MSSTAEHSNKAHWNELFVIAILLFLMMVKYKVGGNTSEFQQPPSPSYLHYPYGGKAEPIWSDGRNSLDNSW